MMRWVFALAVVGLLSHGARAIAWDPPFDSWVTQAGALLSEPPRDTAAVPESAKASNTGHELTEPESSTPQPVQNSPVPAPQLPPLDRTAPMSDWDMYAGSVYANTSPVWVQAEYMLMWTSGTRLPPLLTTSPNGTPVGQAGVWGESGTASLFGDQMIGDDARSGIRTTMGVRLGHWFDYFMDAELEAHLLYLGNPAPNSDFHAASGGDPIMARPFFNVDAGAQDAQLVAFPDVVSGAIDMETSSEFLSTGIVFRRDWRCGSWGRVDWLAGYRHVRFEDRLFIRENLLTTDPGGALPAGTTIDAFDEFKTWSEFNGGELGLQFWTDYHGWTVDVLAKSALGPMSRIVDVQGSTITAEPSGPVTLSSGGLLAQPTNVGRHRSTYFSIVPEIGIRLRRRVSHTFVFTLGYTLILVDHVARVGEQIDTLVNPTQMGGNPLVGAARPHVPMTDRTLWVQGLTVGLEW